jgi:hypothetical protein
MKVHLTQHEHRGNRRPHLAESGGSGGQEDAVVKEDQCEDGDLAKKPFSKHGKDSDAILASADGGVKDAVAEKFKGKEGGDLVMKPFDPSSDMNSEDNKIKVCMNKFIVEQFQSLVPV